MVAGTGSGGKKCWAGGQGPANPSCPVTWEQELRSSWLSTPSHRVGQRLSSRLGQVRAGVQAGHTPWALAPSLCQAGGSCPFLLQAGHLEHGPL